MHGIAPVDPGPPPDWGRTAADYAQHRQGYPPSFYQRLQDLALVRPGLRVLDLATGTGLLARSLARLGCTVSGIDVAPAQIAEARSLAAIDGISVDFRVAAAEQTELPSGSFDLITASQCWLYFRPDEAIAEVRRLLAPGGRLLTCHLCWLPRLDDLARRSEAVVLRHNPAWRGADWAGVVPAIPAWAAGHFDVCAHFCYDEPLRYTRAGWRGRFRACRGVGASLPPEQVQAVDADLAALLDSVPEPFPVLHRIDMHCLAPHPVPDRTRLDGSASKA